MVSWHLHQFCSPPQTLDCRTALPPPPPPPPPPTCLHHMLTSSQLSKSLGSWVLSISTHVYDEQITADSPLIPICKDFASPALLPHALVIKRLQNSCLCAFLDWKKPFVLPRMQRARCGKLETGWTSHANGHVNFGKSKFTVKLHTLFNSDSHNVKVYKKCDLH